MGEIEKTLNGNENVGNHQSNGDCALIKKSNEYIEKIFKSDNNNIIKPPDGGVRAWLILLASFFCNGILFGVINCYGIIFVELKQILEDAGVHKFSSKAALVGSLTIGTTFFLSPIAGILTDRIGIRKTTFLGGFIAAGGMFTSSFFIRNVECLYFTYGLMFGLGASLAYTPSLAILGHYFEKYLGIVNGVATAGSPVFTIIMPIILQRLIPVVGLENTLRILSLLVGCVMLFGLLYKPLKCPMDLNYKKEEKSFKNLVNLDNWKLPKYVIWALCIPTALFGYFVPYVHMSEFCKINFPENNRTLPIICLGLTSGVGRILFGYMADSPKVNRILLQQISFFSFGIMTMLLTLTNSFVWLLVLSLGMGFFDGCFVSLLGPIAFDICGKKGAAQAIGFLFGMCSIPLTVGPPIAGLIFDNTGSYRLPFILAGIPPMVGAIVMFSIRCVKDKPNRDMINYKLANDNAMQPLTKGNEKLPMSIAYKDTKSQHNTDSL